MCEMPTLFEEKDVKARKEHTCYECRLPIPKGVTYKRAKGLWDGDWEEYKMHPECHDKLLEIQDGEFGAEYGTAWDNGVIPQELKDKYGPKERQGAVCS